MPGTCFKVVDPTYKRNLPGFIGVSIAALDAWEVAYRLNEWAFPNFKGSKLFVFANILEAVAYRDSQAPSSRVYECEYQGELVAAGQVADPCSVDRTLLNFWNGEVIGFKIIPPQGTFFVDAVKPFLKVG